MSKIENAGVKGEYFRRKANLKRTFTVFELRTKKRSSEIFAWKMRNFSGKSEIFFGSNRKFLGPD